MPTIAELASLYDPEEVNQNGYHITRLIATSAQSCWASETRGNLAARFNFTHGDVYWLRQFYSGPTRVLPVRDVEVNTRPSFFQSDGLIGYRKTQLVSIERIA